MKLGPLWPLCRGPNFTLRDLWGAFSVITNLRMQLFEALKYTLHPEHDTYIIKSTCHGGGGGHVSRVTRRHQLTFCTVARITLVTGHSGHAGGTTRKWSDAAHAFTSHCPPAHSTQSVSAVFCWTRDHLGNTGFASLTPRYQVNCCYRTLHITFYSVTASNFTMITIIHVNLLKVVVVDAGWLGPGRVEDGGNHAGYWEPAAPRSSL